MIEKSHIKSANREIVNGTSKETVQKNANCFTEEKAFQAIVYHKGEKREPKEKKIQTHRGVKPVLGERNG